jgi:hypothetical protein
MLGFQKELSATYYEPTGLNEKNIIINYYAWIQGHSRFDYDLICSDSRTYYKVK